MTTLNHMGLKAGKELEQAIGDHPFFKGMSAQHLGEILRDAREMMFKPGDVILQEGAPASRFFVIKEGEIALEAHIPENGHLLIETIGPPEVVGWSWLIAPYIWQFTARAVKPTRVIAVNGAHLLGLCESDSAFGYELLKRSTKIILSRLQSARQRLLESKRN